MGLFSDRDKLEELKAKSPVSPELVAIISNTIGEDFEEEIFEGNYMVMSKSKIIAISNKDVTPIEDFGLTEITTKDMQTMQSRKFGEAIGIGQTWVQKEILRKILEALEVYEKKYMIFINPSETNPLIIITENARITLAPIVL